VTLFKTYYISHVVSCNPQDSFEDSL